MKFQSQPDEGRPLTPHRFALPVWAALFIAWTHLPATLSRGADSPPPRQDVVVIYNSAVPESRGVADHYAARRLVPTNHLIGLDLPTTETITRGEYQDRLESPLVRQLVERRLTEVRDRIIPATATAPGRVTQIVTSSQVRHLVICWGVPLRITQDTSLVEAEGKELPELLRRNDAAVDAELTALPLLLAGQPRVGPILNPWLAATNTSDLRPPRGVFVVGRLDGPTPQIARALVDRALEAEENGLLGRGYFDIRSTLNPSYAPGDQWISNAWAVATGYGFDTHLDTRPETLAPGFPLSHVALYAGWYDTQVSGPFVLPQVEFMPGAVAYHLYSFSASTLRSPASSWVATFLQKGVTATMGAVAEPFLDGTPDIGLCLARLMFSGFSWGEAALASQKFLSWQLTVVGDPLYRPFATNAMERAKDLAARGQGRFDWTLAALYNRKRHATGDLAATIAELEKEPRLRFSPILGEKLADFLRDAGEPARAAEWYRRACAWKVSPQQRKRLLWNTAESLQQAGKPDEAYQFYVELARVSEAPPEPLLLLDRLRSLAAALNKTSEAEEWASQLEKLRATQPAPESRPVAKPAAPSPQPRSP